MKVIHLPSSVCGMAYGLVQGERGLGLESDTLVAYPHNNRYPSTYTLFDRPYGKRSDVVRIGMTIPKLLWKYDVLHFNYGSTLMDSPGLGIHLLDLPVYRWAGKRVVVTYNGCDARQKYPTMARVHISACARPDCYNGLCMSGEQDKIRAERIRKVDRYADTIFALNPDIMHFLPERTKFLPYVLADWGRIYPAMPSDSPGHMVTIVHASTNRGAKGTDVIEDVFRRVSRKYPGKVRTIIVENMTNEEAMGIYRTADLIVDQMYIGWYGSFAVECMKMGIPVASYIRKEDLHYIPKDMALDEM